MTTRNAKSNKQTQYAGYRALSLEELALVGGGMSATGDGGDDRGLVDPGSGGGWGSYDFSNYDDSGDYDVAARTDLPNINLGTMNITFVRGEGISYQDAAVLGGAAGGAVGLLYTYGAGIEIMGSAAGALTAAGAALGVVAAVGGSAIMGTVYYMNGLMNNAGGGVASNPMGDISDGPAPGQQGS